MLGIVVAERSQAGCLSYRPTNDIKAMKVEASNQSVIYVFITKSCKKAQIKTLPSTVAKIKSTCIISDNGIFSTSCNYPPPEQFRLLRCFPSMKLNVWPTTVSSPTPVTAGCGRLTSTHASYLGWTPGSETEALLLPVHGIGTLYLWNSISRTLNLLHFGCC